MFGGLCSMSIAFPHVFHAWLWGELKDEADVPRLHMAVTYVPWRLAPCRGPGAGQRRGPSLALPLLMGEAATRGSALGGSSSLAASLWPLTGI